MTIEAPSSPTEVIIGLDVGTTATKAVAFGLDATWQYAAMREYPLLTPERDWQVQDPQVIVEALTAALTECVAAVGSATVIALSVSTGMHGLIGLDAAHRPLTPLLTWADARSRDQAAILRASGAAAIIYKLSGVPVHPMTPLTKIMWFNAHEPALASTVRFWVGLKDFVLRRLTGTLATELSSASATALLDRRRRTWSATAIDLAGISAEQLPAILPTTSALPLDAELAARAGLTAGLPVIVGAGDGPLGNLGTGAMSPGIVGLSLGTSGAARMVVPEPVLDPDGHLFCYALTEDHWVVGGAVSNGGSVVRWAGGVFGGGPEPASDAGLLALAQEVPAGSDGLLMLPYLLPERAPLWDPDLTGAYLGIRYWHTRGHFVRAAVEGVALQLSVIVDRLDRIEPVRCVHATGGALRSTLWRSVLAGAINRPVRVTSGPEGTALGAAGLGLFALDRSPDLTSAVETLAPRVAPASDTMPADQEVYAGLRAAIPRLLASYDEVARLFASVTQR